MTIEQVAEMLGTFTGQVKILASFLGIQGKELLDLEDALELADLYFAGE